MYDMPQQENYSWRNICGNDKYPGYKNDGQQHWKSPILFCPVDDVSRRLAGT